MIEINQILILGIFLFLWGMATLVLLKSSPRALFGLFILLAGAVLLLGGVIFSRAPVVPVAELFFNASVILLAGLAGILVLSFPAYDEEDSLLSLFDQKLSQTSFANLGQLLEFLRLVIKKTEEAGFRQQILLMFFLVVLLLLIKLT